MKKKIGFVLVLGLFAFFLMQLRVQWPQVAQSQTATPATLAAVASAERFWSEKTESERKAQGPEIDLLNKAFVSLAEQMKPAVVNVYTKTRVGVPRYGARGNQVMPDDLFRFFFGNPFGGPGSPGGGNGQMPPREAQALGSGFVINKEGLVITNAHVVRMGDRNADSILLRFVNDSPTSPGYEATVLGVDETTEVAVLRLKKKKADLKVAPLGDSDKIKVGEWVVAIGNPYGHTHTVTKGIVSALGRSLEEIERAEFIQTDASINPGNSGGPLFNLYGEVIGINTAIDPRAQGIGFAIPINTAKMVARELITTGSVSIGWIGVGMSDLSGQLARSLGLKGITEGVLIQEVIPGGPAGAEDIRAYDVVTEAGGKPIKGAQDLSRAIRSQPVGSKVALKIMRDGKPIAKNVTIGRRQSEQEIARQMKRSNPGIGKTEKRLGVALAPLGPATRQKFQIPPHVTGVVIVDLDPEGLAAQAGLAPGDVLTEINRKKVTSPKDAEALLAKGNGFLLKIQRKNASVIISVDLSGDSSAE